MHTAMTRLLLARQGIEGTVNGVKSSFSSWDSCMAKAYCKWPVIIAIIVGSLIVFSILFCCIRCLCCGVECCCGICACFNSCCPSPRGRRDKAGYNDPSHQHSGAPPRPYHGQYQSHAPPSYASPQYTAPSAFTSRQPQYAQFDVSKPANPDALPSMPSWDHAENKKVEVFEDSTEHHELSDLDHNGHKPGTANSQVPMMGGFAADHDGAVAAAAAAATASYGRPGMRTSADSYEHGHRSPYGNESMHHTAMTSPYDERQSYMGDAGHHSPVNHGQYANNGYGGDTRNGYHGIAASSPPPNLHNWQSDRQQSPTYSSPPHGDPTQSHLLQHQAPQLQQYQQPRKPLYQAFSPQEGPSTAAFPAAYPGQRSYQNEAAQRSPVSPISPQHVGYSSQDEYSARGHREQRWQQQGRQGFAQSAWHDDRSRKPVEGTWRDI